MLFASFFFVSCFLPLVCIAYFSVREQYRNAALLVASIIFYAWGGLAHLWLLILLITVNFSLAQETERGSSKRWLWFAVLVNIALLAYFKYFVHQSNLTQDVRHSSTLAYIAYSPIPLGLSFFIFHLISYQVDVARRRAKGAASLSIFSLYIFIFPQLIAGPIIRWHQISPQFKNRRASTEDFRLGLHTFAIGLAQKLIVANPLGRVADSFFGFQTDGTFAEAWFAVFCYALQIYFDFGGYSNMAIGLLRIFGFRIPDNFDFPYSSLSIAEFWRRWHISLSSWFRDYVYLPLGGAKVSHGRWAFNVLLVFSLSGVWHGSSLLFLLWGLWHGSFIIAERFWPHCFRVANWPARRVYVTLVVLFGWVLFRSSDLVQVTRIVQMMLWPRTGEECCVVRGVSNLEFLTFLGASMVFLLPPKFTLPNFAKSRVITRCWNYGGTPIALVASFVYLAHWGFSPFIYFKF